MITNSGCERLQQLIEKGGAGGGLPSYTAEDKRKVLTIAPKMEKFMLIDEQSVYFDDNGEVRLAENSYRLPEGMDVIGKPGHVIITVGSDTVTLDGTFVDGFGINLMAFAEVQGDELEIEAGFTGESTGGVWSSFISSATVTISAYMEAESASVEPTWDSEGLPPYSTEDVDKSLSIVGTPIIENVSIVARQSVTFDENGVGTVTIVDDWQEHYVAGNDEAILSVIWSEDPPEQFSGYYYNEDSLLLIGTDPIQWSINLSGANAGRITVAEFAGAECEVEAWVVHNTGNVDASLEWVDNSIPTITYNGINWSLNKTWQEMYDGNYFFVYKIVNDGSRAEKQRMFISSVGNDGESLFVDLIAPVVKKSGYIWSVNDWEVIHLTALAPSSYPASAGK